MNLERNTVIGINENNFTINNKITYTEESGFPMADKCVNGKLLGLKSANCIFDDERYPEWGSNENPYFGYVSWDYPDGKWNPERNTDEFIKQLPIYRKHGLLLVNVNLMGNQPTGRAGGHPWINSAFTPMGDLKPSYLKRLTRILNEIDKLGMILMVGLFYPRMDRIVMVQDSVEKDDALIQKCIANVMQFLVSSGHRNILVEIGNESNNRFYEHWMLRGDRVYKAIDIARKTSKGLFPISTSIYKVQDIPDNALESMDYILLHNFIGDPENIAKELKETRKRIDNSKAIINKEDTNVLSLVKTLENNASFSFYHQGINNYLEGFQSIPINWSINTVAKWNYFYQVARLTGSIIPKKPDNLPSIPMTKVKGIKQGDKLSDQDIKNIIIEVETPRYFSSSLPLYPKRVEFFIDGSPVKYSGTHTEIITKNLDGYILKERKPSSFMLEGKDLINGPLGFNILNLPKGEHTLTIIPHYTDENIKIGVHKGAFREKTGQLVDIKFFNY